MYDARNVDSIASAMIELTGILNSPRQDEVLLRKAGVVLDRALFLCWCVCTQAER